MGRKKELNLEDAVRWLAFGRACYGEGSKMPHRNYSNDLLEKWLKLFKLEELDENIGEKFTGIVKETRAWLDYVKRWEEGKLGNQLQASEAFQAEAPLPAETLAAVGEVASGATSSATTLLAIVEDREFWDQATRLQKRFEDDESYWAVRVGAQFAQVGENSKVTLGDVAVTMDAELAVRVGQLLKPDHPSARVERANRFFIAVGALVVTKFSYPESTTKEDKAWTASEGIQIAPCLKAILGTGEPFTWNGSTASDLAGHTALSLIQAGQRNVCVMPFFADAPKKEGKTTASQDGEAIPAPEAPKRGRGRPPGSGRKKKKEENVAPTPEPAPTPSATTAPPAAIAPAVVPSSGPLENGASWSLSDATKRAAFLQRAVKENIMDEAETERPDAWELLHERAPSGWLAQGPFGYALPANENWGSLVTTLQTFGFTINLRDFAALSPVRRGVIRMWLEERAANGGNWDRDDVPLDLVKFLPSIATVSDDDAWSHAKALQQEFESLEV